jgi:hypothetical protein
VDTWQGCSRCAASSFCILINDVVYINVWLLAGPV